MGFAHGTESKRLFLRWPHVKQVTGAAAISNTAFHESLQTARRMKHPHETIVG
jgi:hypothetical protein